MNELYVYTLTGINLKNIMLSKKKQSGRYVLYDPVSVKCGITHSNPSWIHIHEVKL